MHKEYKEAFPTRSTERTLLNHWIQLENIQFPGKCLRIKEDGITVDGLGGRGAWTHFKVVSSGNGTVTLWSNQWKTALRCANGTIQGGGDGGPDCHINIVQNPKSPDHPYLHFANFGPRIGVGINDKQQGCVAGPGTWGRFKLYVIGIDGDSKDFSKQKADFEQRRLKFDQRFQAYKKEYGVYERNLALYKSNLTKMQDQERLYQRNIDQYGRDIRALKQQRTQYDSNIRTYQGNVQQLQRDQQNLARQNQALKQREQQIQRNTQALRSQLQQVQAKLNDIAQAAQRTVNLCKFDSLTNMHF